MACCGQAQGPGRPRGWWGVRCFTPLLFLLVLHSLPSLLCADHVVRFEQPTDSKNDIYEILEEEQFLMSDPKHPKPRKIFTSKARNSSNVPPFPPAIPLSKDGGDHVTMPSLPEKTSDLIPEPVVDNTTEASEMAAKGVGEEEEEDNYLVFSDEMEMIEKAEERRREEGQQLARRVKRETMDGSGIAAVDGRLIVSLTWNADFAIDSSNAYRQLENAATLQIGAVLTAANLQVTVYVTGFSQEPTTIEFTLVVGVDSEDRVALAKALLPLRGRPFNYSEEQYGVPEDPQLQDGSADAVFKAVSCIICEQFSYKECIEDKEDPTIWLCQMKSTNFFAFGKNQGDNTLAKGQKKKTKKMKIENGLPIEGELTKKMFISMNGLISFSKKYGSFNPKPLPRGQRQLLCALWANLQLLLEDLRAIVWFQVYKRDADTTDAEQDMLNKGGDQVQQYANVSSYLAVFMVVATFEDMPPDGAPADTLERANFQMAVISDGFTTYAMVLYASGGMLWDATLNRNITIGYLSENPDIDRGALDTSTGNTDLPGTWFFQLSSEVTNNAQDCLNWYLSELPSRDTYKAAMNSLPACPCVMFVALFSNNFFLDSVVDGVVCFINNPTGTLTHGKRCCYRGSTFGFIPSQTEAGSFLLHHPSLNMAGYELNDKFPRQWCCQDSDFCNKFFKVRPKSTCQQILIILSLGTGDPHITTLDSKKFSFNGIGEYIMLKSQEPVFELQTRTCQATASNGSRVLASVFCVFAAKGSNSSFQVGMTRDKTDLVVHLDKQDLSLQFRENADFNARGTGLSLQRLNSSIRAFFDEGIGITVSVENRQLTIETNLFFNNSGSSPTGLLGNNNGDPEDDYIFPNGTTLPGNASEEELLEYGKSWAITADSSLFIYETGKGTADYTDATFKPVILPPENSTEWKDAERVCRGADDRTCLYDYFATNDPNVALGTKTTNILSEGKKKTAANRQPSLDGPSRVNVTLGEPVNFSLIATDEEDETPLIYLIVDQPLTGFTLNESTQTAEWTPDSNNVSGLEFAVKDSQGASSPSLRIEVVHCTGCNNYSGSCDFGVVRPTANNYFRFATCVCEPYYSGDDCENDLNACEDDPCPPDTICTDMTITEHKNAGDNNPGYTCSDCPVGFIRVIVNGVPTCQDIDECQSGSGPCQQECSNTLGSYVCSCNAGYRVHRDNSSLCTDINECQENTHDCQHQCQNTEGGFQCSCFDGYSPNNTAPNTCDKNPAADPCATCQQACRNESGVTQCLCSSGFALAADQRNCENIDECETNQCSQNCADSKGSYACSCFLGYQLDADKVTCNVCPANQYGENCRETCDCRGHGTCNRVRGCVCDSGWAGTSCYKDVDECQTLANPCPDGLQCQNNAGSFTCVCPRGFRKVNSAECVDIDECELASDNTCQQVCTNTLGSYVCSCQAGYIYNQLNNTCDDIDECATDIDDCEYGCENFPGSANCICGAGFVVDDNRRSCVKEKDPCEALIDSKNCTYACQVDNGLATCYCANGYQLATNDVTCIDINECLGNHSCSEQCQNTPGNYQCTCSTGYKLDNDQRSCAECDKGHWGDGCNNTCDCSPLGTNHCDRVTGCVCLKGWQGTHCDRDINECQRDPHPCASIENSECVDTAGSFRCLCLSGYVLNDSDDACVDVDECVQEPKPCDQKCNNTQGSYFCSCAKGFNTDGRSCVDIDECLTHACDQICRNTAGGFSCECEPGFLLNTTTRNTCYVQKECASNNTCEYCVHLPDTGADECYCGAGFELNTTDNTTCDNINECDNSPCINGNCNDSPGSFTCSCGPGTYLLPDHITCSECQEGTFGDNCTSECTCNSTNTLSCDPVSGSCACVAGWNGTNCTSNVDECKGDVAPCENVTNSQCEDTPGSFRCQCHDGFVTSRDQCFPCDDVHYGKECGNECGCVLANTQDCDDVTGACTCREGWKGDNCSVDVNECAASPDPCRAELQETCRNVNGSYVCDCVDGYARPSPSDNCTDLNECLVVGLDNCDRTSQVCDNTDGSFVCVCARGYANISDTCQPTFITVIITIVLDITPDYPLTNAMYKRSLVTSIQISQTEFFQESIGPPFHAVVVTDLWNGSILAMSKLQVDASKTENPLGLAAKAIMYLLEAGVLNVSGKNENVTSASVNGTTVTSENSVCDVFTSIIACDSTQQCTLDSTGLPHCRAIEDSDNTDLIIGLAVGIPLFVLAALVIAGIIFIHVRKRSRHSVDDDASDRTASIFARQLPIKGGWGGAARGLYAPDNRSVSMGSDSSEGHLVGKPGRHGRGLDFKDTPWYDRDLPSTDRSLPGRGADPNNFSWEYLLEPNARFEIQRPQVSPTPDPHLQFDNQKPQESPSLDPHHKFEIKRPQLSPTPIPRHMIHPSSGHRDSVA